jgi:putative oxidoreductase
MQAAVLVARLALGLILIVAGALKLGHGPALASAIAGFRLLSPAVIPLLALALPPLEIFLGLYLVAGLFTRVAGIAAAILFLFYAAAIGSAVVRGIPANCGCFGPADAATADWPHVAFDLILAALGAFIALRAPGALALDRRWTSR